MKTSHFVVLLGGILTVILLLLFHNHNHFDPSLAEMNDSLKNVTDSLKFETDSLKMVIQNEKINCFSNTPNRCEAQNYNNAFLGETHGSDNGAYFPSTIFTDAFWGHFNGAFVYVGFEGGRYPLVIRPGNGNSNQYDCDDANISFYYSDDYVDFHDYPIPSTDPVLPILEAFYTRINPTPDDPLTPYTGVYFSKNTITKVLNQSHVTGITFYYAFDGTNYPLIMSASTIVCNASNRCDIDIVNRVSRGYCPVMCGHSLN